MLRKMAPALVFASGLFVFASSQAADAPMPKGDPGKGKMIAEKVCAACHGPDGNSAVPANPILAAQGEAYLIKQLLNFKTANNKPPARNNPIMMGMAAPLSEADVRDVAAWFNQQKQKPAVAKDPQLVGAGQKLWRQGDAQRGIPACAGCHGPAGAGIPTLFPRLAGQHPQYTETQLKAFRQGDRANDPERMMRAVAAKLSDADIRAVAEYAAGLRQ